ncbi:MAG: anthranilate synthase component I family protein, partial [Proteobacteria bacterium]|nr:anthranilate synthase component I family protein [Pseudomonadota bacterium]
IECNELIIFDNFKGTFYIVVNTTDKSEIGWEKAKKRIFEIKQAIFSLQPSVNQNISIDNKPLKSSSNVKKQTFINQVKDIKKLINHGEIMQAVLSKEITFDGKYDPYTLYRALRLINPSPYMFFLNFNKFRIIGSSPEILVQKNDDKITIRPIAGTRKRGLNKSEDLKNKINLIEDEKEKSEHMMLVDLARNDLSKVCAQGTVQVDEMMVVEKYSHVMHMTSNVIGRSKPEVSSVDCMKAALPAGTLSGAPKIRAMQILREIEQRPRGVYGGAVGYLGFNGSLDTAIVIRTGVHFDDHVKVGVGAGIVFDSDPESEWEETESKVKVFYEALRYK